MCSSRRGAIHRAQSRDTHQIGIEYPQIGRDESRPYDERARNSLTVKNS